jgi:hypothetical protein
VSPRRAWRVLRTFLDEALSTQSYNEDLEREDLEQVGVWLQSAEGMACHGTAHAVPSLPTVQTVAESLLML